MVITLATAFCPRWTLKRPFSCSLLNKPPQRDNDREGADQQYVLHVVTGHRSTRLVCALNNAIVFDVRHSPNPSPAASPSKQRSALGLFLRSSSQSKGGRLARTWKRSPVRNNEGGSSATLRGYRMHISNKCRSPTSVSSKRLSPRPPGAPSREAASTPTAGTWSCLRRKWPFPTMM
jgi:hypothetical protein